MARHLAQATRQLDGPAAIAVDDALAPHWGVLPWRRLRTVIEATVLEVDPDAGAARVRAAEAERFVRVGQANEHGLKLLVARAAAGDVVFFLAMVNRLADILAADGDPDPADVRRSKAIGILANQALALQLLVTHAAPDSDAPEPTMCPEPPDSPLAAEPSGPHMCPQPVDGHTLPATDPEVDGYRSVALPGTGDVRAPDWLAGIDQRRLRPTVMLHVHLTDRALVGADGCPTVARVEDVGPVTLGQVRGFLDNPYVQLRVQPVLDPAATAPADSYEIPFRMREAARLRHLADSFPYGVRDARTMDLDHTMPYQRGGPTSVENLSPLTRHHHRAKTYGGWGKRQPDPDTVVLRSPHGWVYLVTPHGTLDLGRGRYSHAVWDAARPGADQYRPDCGPEGAPRRVAVELAS